MQIHLAGGADGRRRVCAMCLAQKASIACQAVHAKFVNGPFPHARGV